MAFTGFPDGAFEFFRELATHNNPEWFREHESDYESCVVAPFVELVGELAPFFRKLDPLLAVSEDPEDHLSRIESVTTVRPESVAYKTAFHCFFWNRQYERLADGHFFVGLNAHSVPLGFAIYDPGGVVSGPKRIREVFLPRVREDLERLDRYIKDSYLRRGYEFHRYVRASGRLGMREADSFPDRANEWDDTLGWVVTRKIPAHNARLQPATFLKECQDTFRRLYPLYVFASDGRRDWKRRLRA